MSDRMTIAKDGWGEVPDWVKTLIEQCDKPGSSQGKIAKQLGRSSSVISNVLRNRYPGDMDDVEHRIRAVFSPQQVQCPALGWISSADCLRWRDEVQHEKPQPQWVRMYRACNSCARFTKGEEQDDG